MTRQATATVCFINIVIVSILAFTLVSASAAPAQKGSNPLLFLFLPTAIYRTGISDSIALGDVNGDGNPDLVVGNCSDISCNQTGSVDVLLGNGDGSFQSAVAYDAGGFGSNSTVLDDVNGDGKPDLVVVSQGLSASNEIRHQRDGVDVSSHSRC
jgi:microcompartment protein CcmK/EutM